MIFCCNNKKYKGLKLHLRPQTVTFEVDETKAADLWPTIEKLVKEPVFLEWVKRDNNEAEQSVAAEKLKKLGIEIEDILRDVSINDTPFKAQIDRNIVYLYGNGSDEGAYGKYFTGGELFVPNSNLVFMGVDPKTLTLQEITARIAHAVKGGYDA